MNAPLNLTSAANPFDAWFQPVQALKGKSLMDHLYNRLDGAYPHKWRSNFPSPEAIDNWSVSWAEAFEDEGITPSHIKAGLKACRSQFDWPPSCAEFIKACKSEVKPTAHVFALPAPKSNLSREKAAQMMEELGASGILKPKNDEKRWAKRIIEKSKEPRHGLSMLQIQFAKEALSA